MVAHGSLCLVRGTLFVGVHAKTARVRAFDLGGRELPTAFAFRDARSGRSSAAGIAVDADHTLWIADTPADRVRRFSLFGREVGGFGTSAPGAPTPILPGSVVRPVDVEVVGGADAPAIAVACAGESRHALQLFEPDGSLRASLRAHGEPDRAFRALTRIAAGTQRLYAVEGRDACVQVFRAGEFLFAFRLSDARGRRLEPSAIAPLDDGRLVLACRAPESALLLLDGSGRLLRALAGPGEQEGAIHEPSDLAVERGAEDRRARLFVLDREGLRVQVFTLEGRALGAIPLVAALRGSRRARRSRRHRENEGGR